MCKDLTYVCQGRFTCVQARETRVKGGRGGEKRQARTQAIPILSPPNRIYVRWVCAKGTVSICKACSAHFTFAFVKSSGRREARRVSTRHKCQGCAPLDVDTKNVTNVKNAPCTTQPGGLYTYRSVRRESTLDICDTDPICLSRRGLRRLRLSAVVAGWRGSAHATARRALPRRRNS
jgi:hypothetical protein